jgi:hypothetical protein
MVIFKGKCIQCGGEYDIERGKGAASINMKHLCEDCAHPKPEVKIKSWPEAVEYVKKTKK